LARTPHLRQCRQTQRDERRGYRWFGTGPAQLEDGAATHFAHDDGCLAGVAGHGAVVGLEIRER
jgi:hypothetical protein